MLLRCLTLGILFGLTISTVRPCGAQSGSTNQAHPATTNLLRTLQPPPQTDANAAPTRADTSFKYKFENERFYIPFIEVDVTPNGSGGLKFKRGESDETIERDLKVLPGTVDRLNRLIDRLSFLTTEDDYQSKKDFSHLGWITVTVRRGSRERTVRFNYTTNPSINEMADILRGIATQEIDLFDLDLALKHQPLETPRIMETIESDLRLDRIAEPERIVAALREIAGDDTLPLIARNHATRLVSAIQKGKYKGPQRSGK
ncbi:MAG TPA: hypothetical protein VFV34_16725 [Blastocatellia bacterium]|nr:hypothetical protein [Blastocatellia bacterium]